MDVVKILLCEGGDVEARTSKHIFMLAFDPLSLNSISLHIFHCFTLFIFIYMLDIVCVPTLMCNQESFYSTSTLNLEEPQGVVSKPFTGNSGSFLVTHCVFAIKFLNFTLFVLN